MERVAYIRSDKGVLVSNAGECYFTPVSEIQEGEESLEVSWGKYAQQSLATLYRPFLNQGAVIVETSVEALQAMGGIFAQAAQDIKNRIDEGEV